MLHLFDEVAEVVRSLVPAEYADHSVRARRWGIKLWFGGAQPGRSHYEAQVMSAQLVPDAETLALEIGWHAELKQEADNESLLSRVVAAEPAWRGVLGDEAVAGEFLGRDDWRRLSEVWPDPDLSDPDLGFEIAARLTDYVTCVEAALRGP